MKIGLVPTVIGLGMVMGSAAFAQDAPPPPPASEAPAAQAPAADSFSDEDVQKFARAEAKVTAIQADTAVAAEDKQAQMMEAVQAEGLAPQRFNAIAQAAQNDPQLMQRIQQASPDAGQSQAQ